MGLSNVIRAGLRPGYPWHNAKNYRNKFRIVKSGTSSLLINTGNWAGNLKKSSETS